MLHERIEGIEIADLIDGDALREELIRIGKDPDLRDIERRRNVLGLLKKARLEARAGVQRAFESHAVTGFSAAKALCHIKDVLIQQIKAAEAVFVLPSLYETEPDLVNFMMDGADAAGLPMIVIKPFGAVAETPPELIKRAQEHIEWNAREMVDAVRRQARLEDTARWDVVDFPGYDEHGKIEDSE